MNFQDPDINSNELGTRSTYIPYEVSTARPEGPSYFYLAKRASQFYIPYEYIVISLFFISRSESSSLFKSVQVCSRLFKSVQDCSRLFKSVQDCSRLFKSVQVCSRLFIPFKSVQVRSRLFKTAQDCSKTVKVCSRLFKTVQVSSVNSFLLFTFFNCQLFVYILGYFA